MATTLKDIAAAAGVSIGTVDRALKHRGRINPQVAERICELAKEMNYHPNRIASGLVKRNRGYQIAVIFHNATNDFWDEVIKGIHKAEKEIKDYGISVKLYFGKNFDVQTQLNLIDKAIAEGANGVIIVPINSPLISRRLRQLHKEEFPVVFLNTFLNRTPCFCSIHCDYYRSGRIAGMLIDRMADKSGSVLAFLPSSAMLGNNRRKEGLSDYMKEFATKLKLVKIVEICNNVEEDGDLILKELREHPEVEYIVYNGAVASVLPAIEEVDQKYTSVLFDLTCASRQALLDGKTDVVISQSAMVQGYRAVDVLFRYFTSDTKPPKEILLENNIIFKECIDEEQTESIPVKVQKL